MFQKLSETSEYRMYPVLKETDSLIFSIFFKLLEIFGTTFSQLKNVSFGKDVPGYGYHN